MRPAHMRKILVLLLSLVMIAATVESGALRCMNAAASSGNSHSCCDDERQALSPAAPATCCAISQAAQPGPVESRASASQGSVSCQVRAASLDASGCSLRNMGLQPPLCSTASSVPIYLHNLSLLI